jgi:phosphatidylserine/phosphatidylglycerophosphate/cardiolipin synthase-like enzyme
VCSAQVGLNGGRTACGGWSSRWGGGRRGRWLRSSTPGQRSPTPPGLALGAAIAAAAHAHDEARRNPHLKLVVSGPTSTVIHARRTEQVLLQLIAEARREILLLTFALQMHDGLRRALGAASSHGVRLTVLAEDPTDNHGFSGDPGTALIGVLAQRLRWPAEKRPANGAAMHAKIVAVDATTALITSANLTRRAAGDNLEVGVLIRGGDIPERLARHVAQLPAAARSMTGLIPDGGKVFRCWSSVRGAASRPLSPFCHHSGMLVGDVAVPYPFGSPL